MIHASIPIFVKVVKKDQRIQELESQVSILSRQATPLNTPSSPPAAAVGMTTPLFLPPMMMEEQPRRRRSTEEPVPPATSSAEPSEPREADLNAAENVAMQ